MGDKFHNVRNNSKLTVIWKKKSARGKGGALNKIIDFNPP